MADSARAEAPGGWEPLAHHVRLRLTASDLNALDAFAASIGVSRSWFLRRAIALGAQAVVDEVREARQAGVAPTGAGLRPAAALGLSPAHGGAPSLVAWAPSDRRRPALRHVDLLDD